MTLRPVKGTGCVYVESSRIAREKVEWGRLCEDGHGPSGSIKPEFLC